MSIPDWWKKPRNVSVVVDNESWILPYARELVDWAQAEGDKVFLIRDHAEVMNGAVAFYLGCTRITPPEILAKNRRNLVVHESDLPKGRGFAPVAWQIIEGSNYIPVCLIQAEAEAEADGGPIVYSDSFSLSGNELLPEWRHLQGKKTIELCQRYLLEPTPPKGNAQIGNPTQYSRRRPEDSRLDPERTIAEQFDLFRVVDNNRYPAFFEYRGRRYTLEISVEDKDG